MREGGGKSVMLKKVDEKRGGTAAVVEGRCEMPDGMGENN